MIVTLVNTYGPNTHSPQFRIDFKEEIKDFITKHTIMCGDGNIALDPEKDTVNYVHDNNPTAQQKVKEMMCVLNLNDIWRFTYPPMEDYTFSSSLLKEGLLYKLDYFFADIKFH